MTQHTVHTHSHTYAHLKPSFSKQYLHLYMWCTLVFYFLFYSISLHWFHDPLMDGNLHFEKHWSNRWSLVLEGDWGRCCSWRTKFRWATPKAVCFKCSQQIQNPVFCHPWILRLEIVKNNFSKKNTTFTEDLLSAENWARYFSEIKIQIVNALCP